MASPKRPTFIRQWRKHRGKTLEQLGEAVDMSHAQVSRIERGLQPYSQPVLEAIADALQTDPASLLMRDPSVPSVDALLRDQPQEVIDLAMKLIAAIRR
jgi:transcriptional regulator with XRE-family HTH domain